MPKLTTLHDLFAEEMTDLYSAEQQILKALPKMIKKAVHQEVADAFNLHLEQTQDQIARLEEVCENLDIKLKRKVCKGMEGIIEEAKVHMEEDVSEELTDLVLISLAQRVEHYEIAGYGTVLTYAKVMGHDTEADLLETTLNEEADTDKILTKLAKKLYSGVTLMEE
ncbi:ferritin-like domain-containing protein [Candidatus Woesebacteria bacterium]|nr:ferritin-like domain-containing protein [Candidatus Woesebacteria bacterium]